MREFDYIIKDMQGLHARPATLLVKIANEYKSTVVIFANEKQANCSSIFQILKLAAKQGQNVKIRIEGEDEDDAYERLLSFCCSEI